MNKIQLMSRQSVWQGAAHQIRFHRPPADRQSMCSHLQQDIYDLLPMFALIKHLWIHLRVYLIVFLPLNLANNCKLNEWCNKISRNRSSKDYTNYINSKTKDYTIIFWLYHNNDRCSSKPLILYFLQDDGIILRNRLGWNKNYFVE